MDGSRSAEPPISAGSRGGDRIHHLARGASRVAMPLASAGKTGMSASQPSRQLAAQAALQLVGELGKGLRVGRHALVPRRLRARAARQRLAEMRQRRRRARGTAARSASRGSAWSARTSSAPSGEPCASKRVLLVGRAVADVGAHQDQRRPRALRARGFAAPRRSRRGRCRRRPTWCASRRLRSGARDVFGEASMSVPADSVTRLSS